MQTSFSVTFDDVIHEPVLYGDFVATGADKNYQEIQDIALVKFYIKTFFLN